MVIDNSRLRVEQHLQGSLTIVMAVVAVALVVVLVRLLVRRRGG